MLNIISFIIGRNMLDTFISIPKRIVAEKITSKYFLRVTTTYCLQFDTYAREQNRRFRSDMCQETENSNIFPYVS